MAKIKETSRKKRNVNIPEGILDYYAMYALDRNADTREIRKQLLQKQGEIRSNMANGSLNSEEILEKLQEAYNTLAAAIKIFKTEERRKEYDLALDAAYETGKLDVQAQSMAQDLYEEIEALFLKGNYHGAVRKCLDALNNNVRDYRIYILLAQSYFALNDPDRSITTVEDGLKVHPDNVPLLRAGARFANEGKQDYDRAQKYVNRMMELDPESAIANSEQSYLYLTSGKQDLAYQQMDKYMEKHPNDTEFRKDCAYDLVGYSYSCYTKDPESGAYVIASQEDYQKCLDSCSKAMSLYNDENVQTAMENAKYFGTVEFNDENKDSIKWLFIGAAIYLLGGVIGFSTGIQEMDVGFFGTLGGSLVFWVLGALLVYAGIRLRQVSYRPYWQINKFIMTGKREKSEGVYILIGKIFAGYMKMSIKIGIKISVWFINFAFDLISH